MENVESSNSDPRKLLQEIQNRHQQIWDKQDIKAMALESVDSLCIYVEDGMDPKKALDKIFRFVHGACDSICYDVHENWREELKEFYKSEFINKESKNG